jgi:hypothetical protein
MLHQLHPSLRNHMRMSSLHEMLHDLCILEEAENLLDRAAKDFGIMGPSQEPLMRMEGGNLRGLNGQSAISNMLRGEWKASGNIQDTISLQPCRKGLFYSDHPCNAGLEKCKHLHELLDKLSANAKARLRGGASMYEMQLSLERSVHENVWKTYATFSDTGVPGYFGWVPKVQASGFSVPSFGSSAPVSGSSAPTFNGVPSFGSSAPAFGFGSSAPAFGFGSSAPAFGFGSSAPAFGSSAPAFGFGSSEPKKTPEDSCRLKLTTTPLLTATILQDLKVLPQLRRVSIQPKDYHLLLNKNWKMGCTATTLNTTLQELLEELKTLPDTYDEDALVKKTADMGQHRLSMDHAKRIRTLIPDIVRETHRTISTLIAQLSPCVQECLRAGLPIQTIEDALDSKLQEANYAFARKV